jgi:hypothetical protein
MRKCNEGRPSEGGLSFLARTEARVIAAPKSSPGDGNATLLAERGDAARRMIRTVFSE